MATQTRRTTRRAAQFFRTTVTASMVTACCGLVLWSAVAAHASQSWNGIPWNGMPPNGMPFQGLSLNGAPYNGLFVNGTPLQGMPMQGMPHNGVPIQGMALQGMPHNDLPTQEGALLPTVQRESLPWSTLSQRPLGDAAVPFVRDSRDTLPVALPEVR